MRVEFFSESKNRLPRLADSVGYCSRSLGFLWGAQAMLLVVGALQAPACLSICRWLGWEASRWWADHVNSRPGEERQLLRNELAVISIFVIDCFLSVNGHRQQLLLPGFPVILRCNNTRPA